MHHWLRSDGRPCYPAISLPYALPNLFPYHMHPIPHHTTLPLILSYLPTPHLSIFRSLLSHHSPLHLSCHPLPTSFLPPPSPFLFPSPTRPHLSLFLPGSNPILPLLCFPHV